MNPFARTDNHVTDSRLGLKLSGLKLSRVKLGRREQGRSASWTGGLAGGWIVLLLLLTACDGLGLDAARLGLHGQTRRHTGAVRQGELAIQRYGCAACHTIPGIRGADALVGPPLDHMGRRTYIAGVMINTPENMVQWLMDPPAINPLTAMPHLGVTYNDARNITNYLYTLE
jgi:cytochrome c